MSTSPALSTENLDLLSCPRCDGGTISLQGTALKCDNCSAEYPIEQGIPALLKHAGAGTQLEDIDYDDLHQVNTETAEAMYRTWKTVIDRFDIQNERALEIGSGTGYLSYGMLKHAEFQHYIPTDISVQFLSELRARTSPLEVDPILYAADANYLPFKADSFDAVLGNSVLHHFLDYPSTIEQSFRLLKPGGIAVFFEPVASGNGFIGMLVKMMLKVEEEFKMKVFTREERRKMNSLVQHPLILKRNKHKRIWLQNIEDKYVFDTHEMAKLADKIGYQDFQAINPNNAIIKTYTPYVKRKLVAIHKIPMEKINRFDFLFECFPSTIGELAPESLDAPMQFLVFRK